MSIRRVYLIITFGILCLNTLAQINLRQGLVITLQGDTIYGSIDYRSDHRNSNQCVFISDKSQQYQTYKPGEIYGYRFLDNGRFYVSKVIPQRGGEKDTLFLEFIVRAQLNLYFYGDKVYGNCCYIESEEGDLVPVMEESVTNGIDVSQRRKKLTPAFRTLAKSPKATRMLWKKELNLSNVTQIIQTYNDEVCPDGVCEIFEYKSKKTPKEDRIVRFVAAAGMDFMTMDFPKVLNKSHQLSTQRFDLVCPYVEVGADIYMDRIWKGPYFLVRVNYRKANTEFHFPLGTIHRFEGNLYGAKVAIGYQLKKWKVQPRVFVGGTYNQLLIEDDDIRHYTHMMFGKWGDAHAGIFGGAGITYPLKRGTIVLDASYESYRGGISNIKMTSMCWRLGYQF